MKIELLTDENIVLYAAHFYDNIECTGEDEFYEDLNKTKNIKRTLRKLLKSDKMQTKHVRMALNNIIMMVNVFGVKAAANILFFKMDEDLYSYLKTFLLYINCLPRTANKINTNDIKVNTSLQKILQEL